jgi:hypothetical protein
MPHFCDAVPQNGASSVLESFAPAAAGGAKQMETTQLCSP